MAISDGLCSEASFGSMSIYLYPGSPTSPQLTLWETNSSLSGTVYVFNSSRDINCPNISVTITYGSTPSTKSVNLKSQQGYSFSDPALKSVVAQSAATSTSEGICELIFRIIFNTVS